MFIDVDAKAGRLLDMRAEAGGTSAAMGGTLRRAAGAAAKLWITARGVPGGQIAAVLDGTPMPYLARPVLAAGFALAVDGKRHWRRAQVRDVHGRFVLIGNPLYIEP